VASGSRDNPPTLAVVQILEAWAGIAQHFKLQRSAADELQKRNMHKTLRVCLGSWAAHAKDMQQLRQVASAHGDAVAKQLAHSQMHMSLTVSILLPSTTAQQPDRHVLQSHLSHKSAATGLRPKPSHPRS